MGPSCASAAVSLVRWLLGLALLGGCAGNTASSGDTDPPAATPAGADAAAPADDAPVAGRDAATANREVADGPRAPDTAAFTDTAPFSLPDVAPRDPNAPDEIKGVPALARTTSTVDDYLDEVARWYFARRAERIATIRTPADVRTRQAYVRQRMLDGIGGFPSEKTPLNPRITGTLTFPGFRVEKLIYESQPSIFVTANLYVPTTGPGPFPAALSVAGHGITGKAGGPRYLAASLARRGFVVLAYDPPGQGERVDPSVADGNGLTVEHSIHGVGVLLTGMGYARYEMWDGIRGVDYLFTRPEVDKTKGVGVLGCSGGGTQSAYMAAFDTRIGAAAPACYMSAWPQAWDNYRPGDSEQVFVNFLRDGLDFSDFPLAMAPAAGGPPRAFKILQGAQDVLAPITGTRATFAQAKEFYRIIGAEDQMDFLEVDTDHGWGPGMEVAAKDWLERWIYGRPPTSPSYTTPPGGMLACTSTGQVATGIPGAKTVQMFNAEVAARIFPDRSAAKVAGAAELRPLVAARIGVTPPAAAPPARKVGETTRTGYVEEQLTVETEARFALPVTLLRPAAPPAARTDAILFVGSRMTEAGALDPDAVALAGSHVVLMVEPRGTDLCGSQRARCLAVDTDPELLMSPSAGGTYFTAMRAILLGKTMVGMRVTDVLGAFAYLAGRPDVDPARIAIYGKGRRGAVAALHAAFLEPRIRKVAVEDLLLSYMNFVSVKQHLGVADLVIPGVLRDYDLPDLAKGTAPRTVWVVSPRNAGGGTASPADAQAAYGATGARVLERGAGASFASVYGPWLAAP